MADLSDATVELNPDLDLASYAREYAERGIVQIPNLFPDPTARAMARIFREAIPWRLIATDDADNPVQYTAEQWRALGADAQRSVMQACLDRARQNRGYIYNGYHMIEAYLEGRDPGHPIHQLTEFLNGEDWLGLGREVLGNPAITKADAHATLYAPGHYLTRHNDLGEIRERRAAYVIGLTERWEPDWGGLLLFLDERLDIRRGLTPRFNVVTIFDVNYIHAVTQVATFAPAGRYSIAGWFRDDPPVGKQAA